MKSFGWPKFGVSVGVKIGQVRQAIKYLTFLIKLVLMGKVGVFIIHWCRNWWISYLSYHLCNFITLTQPFLWHTHKNPNINAVYIIVLAWFSILLRRTIIGATFQQQSAFIQVTEFGDADEIVVHSRNLPLSGLPSGACRWPQQWQGLGHQIKWNAPFTREGVDGGVGSSAACTGFPTGMWFTCTRSRKVQTHCLHHE